MTTEPLRNLRANTIDEVISSLDKIIEWSKHHKSRMGYFAALYRKVTVKVKEGIAAGIFQNGELMERLDVLFANRYLEAFEQWQSCRETTHSWKLAFDTAGRWRPIVLQHLFLGMNTHIDLDLGIAAAETVNPGKIEEIRADFFKINDILASLVNEVQEELAEVWPLLKWLDRVAAGTDEALSDFGMKITRRQAWKVARDLSPLTAEERLAKIADLDQSVSRVGKAILYQGRWLWIVLLIIRLTELRSVPRIIEILE